MKMTNISYHFTGNTKLSFISNQKQYFSTYIQLHLVMKDLELWNLPAISDICDTGYDLQELCEHASILSDWVDKNVWCQF